jgi:tripartite ATP-independent transporter DctP family solute receptor
LPRGRRAQHRFGIRIRVTLTRRAFLGAAAAACAGVTVRAQVAALELTATDVHVQGYPTVEALRWIDETLLHESNGRLRLRLYHSGQLGRESDSIDMTRFGALDITRVNMAALNNPFPATRVLSLPYVFDSTDHMRRSLDGAVGREILAAFAARDLVGLAFYDSGARCFYNTRRPVVVPQDLQGLKIRVPPSDIFMDMVGGLGANPTPLPYGEVFSALQTHLIDGAENNWQSFHTTRQFEVAHYWSQSEHSYSPEAVLMSRRRLDAMAPDDRALLTDICARSVPVMRGLWDKSEVESREFVLGKGVKTNAVDRGAFVRASTPVLNAWLRDASVNALYKGIRALA